MPPADLKLRFVKASDAASIHKTCWPHLPLARVQARVQRAADGQAPLTSWGVVATTNQDVIAYGQLMRWGSKAEISDLVVSPGWRGHGIGTALIVYLLELARQQKFDRVEIGAAHSNPRALELYRRLGFADHREVILDVGQGPEPIVYLAYSDKEE